MRYHLVVLVGASLAATLLTGCKSSSVETNDATRFAYGVGYSLGEEVRTGLAADGLSADADLVHRGFNDALRGNKPAMPKHELDRVLRSVHRTMLDRSTKKLYDEDPAFRQLADASAAKSANAIQVFAAQPGVRTVEKGAYTLVVTPGTGAQPGGDALYVVDWTLTLANGSAIDNRKDAVVDPDMILPIASRVLRSMRVGDHWKIALAPELAFGIGGDAPAIGPNEALFLDVTITGCQKRETKQ